MANWTKEVLSKKQPPQLCTCPNCNGEPKYFNHHSFRQRIFLVIIEGFVNKVYSYVSRWKCPVCGKTFTYYPEFLLPYKRYLKDDIIRLSQKYVEDDNTTYRKIVTHEGASIVYHGSESYFEGSTVWRWLSFTGSLVTPLSNGLNLIKQKSPESGIFRKIRPINFKKYRSEYRKNILSNALRVFICEEKLRTLFGTSIFSPSLQRMLC